MDWRESGQALLVDGGDLEISSEALEKLCAVQISET